MDKTREEISEWHTHNKLLVQDLFQISFRNENFDQIKLTNARLKGIPCKGTYTPEWNDEQTLTMKQTCLKCSRT